MLYRANESRKQMKVEEDTFTTSGRLMRNKEIYSAWPYTWEIYEQTPLNSISLCTRLVGTWENTTKQHVYMTGYTRIMSTKQEPWTNMNNCYKIKSNTRSTYNYKSHIIIRRSSVALAIVHGSCFVLIILVYPVMYTCCLVVFSQVPTRRVHNDMLFSGVCSYISHV